MIISTTDSDGAIHAIDPTHSIDISIPLRFNGPQPNAFGVDPAAAKACEYGDLVGDTRRGGSCNFEQITLIPHCNGTHTECVGHIINERISIRDCLTDVFIDARLVTIQPLDAARCNETYPCKFGTADLVITRELIASKISINNVNALIVRTLPNDTEKLSRIYQEIIPPYFTSEAMEFIVGRGVRHLLVDMPSIDRLYDGGKLSNHRTFWSIDEGRFETTNGTRMDSTITEMIFVPDEVEDGSYLLNLQIPPFESDAAPSRPILFKTKNG
jgi:kynurenine formamidase